MTVHNELENFADILVDLAKYYQQKLDKKHFWRVWLFGKTI